MTNFLRKYDLSPYLRRFSVPKFEPTVPLDCYSPLVQMLFEVREAQEDGIVVAFTSIARGEGVTHVVESLGRKLAEHTWEQILLTTAANLAGAGSALLDASSDVNPQIQRLGRPRAIQQAARSFGLEDVHRLRRRFGFVLVDCPALRSSSAILSMSASCDGAVLVVASGEARRSEIQNAQKILNASSVKLLGLILNKHVDPVPGFVSRLF